MTSLGKALASVIIASAALASAQTEIEAAKFHYDDKAQLSTFSGNVLLTGDGITLKADNLVVEGRQDDTRYEASGTPASLQFDTSGGRSVTASGDSISFNPATERISVSQGKLNTSDAVISADRIDYFRDNSLKARGRIRLVHEGMKVSGDTLAVGALGAQSDVNVTGSPATVEGIKETTNMQATALTIVFQTAESRIRLTGNAVAQNVGGEIASDVIVYDTADNSFVAVSEDVDQRVTMVINGDDEPDATRKQEDEAGERP